VKYLISGILVGIVITILYMACIPQTPSTIISINPIDNSTNTSDIIYPESYYQDKMYTAQVNNYLLNEPSLPTFSFNDSFAIQNRNLGIANFFQGQQTNYILERQNELLREQNDLTVKGILLYERQLEMTKGTLRVDPSCDSHNVKLKLYGYNITKTGNVPALIKDASLNIVNLETRQIVAKDRLTDTGIIDAVLCRNEIYNVTVNPAPTRGEVFDQVQYNIFTDSDTYNLNIHTRIDV
jgi:hypothetical protein